MLKRSLFLAAALAVPLPLSADVVTKKFDWQPVSGIQRVEVALNDVVVSQVKFDLGDTVPPIRISSAKAIVRVDNNSERDQEVGVAVVVFDEQGNVVAAGNGGNKLGELNKGEREEFTVRFSYVYRHLREARSFLVTLETKEKGKGRYRSRTAPTPEPEYAPTPTPE